MSICSNLYSFSWVLNFLKVSLSFNRFIIFCYPCTPTVITRLYFYMSKIRVRVVSSAHMFSFHSNTSWSPTMIVEKFDVSSGRNVARVIVLYSASASFSTSRANLSCLEQVRPQLEKITELLSVIQSTRSALKGLWWCRKRGCYNKLSALKGPCPHVGKERKEFGGPAGT